MSPIKIKFVSRKINKIKFLPKNSSMFVTGSWDDDVNNLCVWKFSELPDVIDDTDNEIEYLVAVASKEFQGCVTDLSVLSDELIFASSSLGSVFMFKYSDEKLQCIQVWKNVHAFGSGPASATGIAVKGQDIASVGEDGKLCLFNLNVKKKVREIESSDLCSFNCVTYLRHQEIVAGNSLGYLRLWDLRISSDASSCLLTLSREQRGVSSMNVHPTQSHILATGYEDGSMCIWDMRQEKKPMSLLDGHFAAVTTILFHPNNPDFIFTSSMDGSVWQWDSSKLRNNVSSVSGTIDSLEQSATKGNPWLYCDVNKHKLDLTSIFSQTWTCVNSLDLSGSMLIWGTDNEELCILNDIIV